MSVICHTFIGGVHYQECRTWEEVNRTPSGAYMSFPSGSWYVMVHDIKEYVNTWDVPKEVRTLALLMG